jgi:lipopolysaccharide export system protein LptA
MVYDDQKQESTYIGNVFLKTGQFEASDAAKAVYNHTTKKITVYDCKEFSFTEKLVMKPGKKSAHTIEYVLGDNKAILF